MKDYKDITKETRERTISVLLQEQEPSKVRLAQGEYVKLSSNQIKVLKEYDKFNVNKGNSITTRINYIQVIRLLGITLKKDFKSITSKDIENYIYDLSKTKKSSTIHTIKINIIEFFKWLYEDKKDNIEAIKLLSVTFQDDELPEDILTQQDIKELTRVASTLRDKAIIMSLYESGARKGEFLQLKIKDLSFDEYGAMIRLPKGKTKGRTLRLIISVPYLRQWIESHENKNLPDSPLFITQQSHKGRPLGESGLKQVLISAKNKTTIKKKVYPHLLRHSRATELAGLGWTESDMRIYFGWSQKSQMPSKYIHRTGKHISEKVLEMHGKKKILSADSLLKPIECPRCKKENPATSDYCQKCWLPLSQKVIEEIEDKKETGKKVFEKLKEKGQLTFDKSTIKEVLKEMIKTGEIKI